MKIKIIVIGKTHKNFLIEGENEYLKRLKRYTTIEKIEIPDLKNTKHLSASEIKKKEGVLILQKLESNGFVVVLDENGKSFGSVNFANWLQEKMNRGYKNITFIIGGAYGFSDAIYQKANEKMSLSKMTFSHQMIRMIFAEQLYRAHTILNNEPYHHQ